MGAPSLLPTVALAWAALIGAHFIKPCSAALLIPRSSRVAASDDNAVAMPHNLVMSSKFRGRSNTSSACSVEQAVAAPEASRPAACTSCSEFAKINPNLCAGCYSVISSCDRSSFAWSCYDENDMFKVFAKQESDASLDEPSEMHESFKSKEPEKCS
mmetsp:Transcript_33217/g.84556  ORF Transcript_33217/g.84556 Transcript_33217/m.84556 type:complete len:157 (+) Transcript_33217:80-550(+)